MWITRATTWLIGVVSILTKSPGSSSRPPKNPPERTDLLCSLSVPPEGLGFRVGSFLGGLSCLGVPEESPI